MLATPPIPLPFRDYARDVIKTILGKRRAKKVMQLALVTPKITDTVRRLHQLALFLNTTLTRHQD